MRASLLRHAYYWALRQSCIAATGSAHVTDMSMARSLQEALDLEEGQEEAWVIRGIGLKLLEARIDQMRRSVTVTKLTQRAFTSAQWADLRAQLAAWKVCPEEPPMHAV